MKFRRQRTKHNVKIVFPSTITTFSMVFGFIGILLAINGQFAKAGYMVMISIIMDGLDGKVARITNTASEFGIQYDSLSDLVAFGVTPCIIYTQFYLHQQVKDSVYYLLPIMFLTCGAIRLARFNVTASIYGKTHFTGLPIPAGAFAMVTGPIFYEWASRQAIFNTWDWDVYLTKDNFFQFSIVFTVVLSLSMISTLKCDTPAGFWFHKFRWKPLNYIVLFAVLSVNFIHFSVFAVVMTVYYLTSMYGRALYHKIHKTHGENLDDDHDDDPDLDAKIVPVQREESA